MPSYNFKQQFAEAVRTGAKRQTIRQRGKRKPPKAGDIAHCFTGLRTQQVSRLGKFPIESVEQIGISASGRTVSMPRDGRWHELDEAELQALAQADGFASVDDFFAFFQSEHGLTFSGYLIKWRTA